MKIEIWEALKTVKSCKTIGPGSVSVELSYYRLDKIATLLYKTSGTGHFPTDIFKETRGIRV